MEVSRATPETVDVIWQQFLPMTRRALTHGAGDHTNEQAMLADLKRGDSLLWVIHEGGELVAGLVVSVSQHPAKRVVYVELCAGRDLDKWIEQIETLLKDYRDLAGADSVEASCRAGLARRLRKRGWSAKSELLELT